MRVLGRRIRRFFRGPVPPSAHGFLTPDQHHEAARLIGQTSIETQMEALGVLGDRERMMTRAAQLGIPFVDLQRVKIESGLRLLIPEEVMVRHCVVPIQRREMSIWLATYDISSVAAIDEVRLLTGCRILPVLAEEQHIRAQLRDWGIVAA